MRRVIPVVAKARENHWADGCGKCRYGIAAAPELTGACNLHLERLAQFVTKQITFCGCQAGMRYQVYLRNLRQRMIEEARTSPLMGEYAKRLTHPDIEMALWQITESYTMMAAPTVHYEAAPTPQPEPTV